MAGKTLLTREKSNIKRLKDKFEVYNMNTPLWTMKKKEKRYILFAFKR